jgi:hypothetical protein
VGTRVCLLVAGLLVIAAGYLLVMPLERVGSQGPPFDCGTALAPAAGDFARGVCGDLNQRQRLQGGAILLAAIALAGGGRLAFGPAWRRRRTEEAGWPGGQPAYRGSAAEWGRPPSRPALSSPVPPSPREHHNDEPPARQGGAHEADSS